MNNSGPPNALDCEMLIMPVVHGKPTLVAMFVVMAVIATLTDIATLPLVAGTLTATTAGDIGAGVPGVVCTFPAVPPAATIDPG